MKRTSTARELKRRELRQKLSSLEENIRIIRDDPNIEQLTYEQLEAQRAELRNEYKLLVELLESL
jgi:tRNA(Ile)-lysidine synthase TilS/MesJ